MLMFQRTLQQKRMSLTLSRADVSGSRGEALSSVHNQGFEVVTRSTTDIAASSTTTTLIDQSSDPLLSSTAPIFTGANIGSISGCTFQIFHSNVKIVQNERKSRIVIDSDSWGWLTLKLFFVTFVQFWITCNFHSFTWHWLDPYFVTTKILFDRRETLSRVLESTTAFLRFCYKEFLKVSFKLILDDLFFELVVACFCLSCSRHLEYITAEAF